MVPPSEESTDAATDDVDPAELQRQLADIKGAMGLEERYPGQRKMWLVYGVTIGLTVIVTNFLFALDLPPAGYIGLWFLMAAVIVVAQWRLVSGTAADTASTGPAWRVIGGSLVAGLFALWSAVADPIGASTTGAEQGAHYFSHLVLFLGLGFLIAGAALKAEQIRRRDRLPFYVGGLWMLVFAALLPWYEFLHLFGYMVFGGLFLAHSIAAYVLTKPD
jgi:hypothetical protein